MNIILKLFLKINYLKDFLFIYLKLIFLFLNAFILFLIIEKIAYKNSIHILKYIWLYCIMIKWRDG